MATQPEKAWVASRAAALADVPGKHRHPTLRGFFMQVSPKKKAVYGYRIRDHKGKFQGDTFGEVAERSGRGLTLDKAVQLFEAKRAFYKAPDRPEQVTLAVGFQAWMQRERKGGGKRSDRTNVNYNEVYDRRLKELGGHLVLSETDGDRWEEVLKVAKFGAAEKKVGEKVVPAKKGSPSEARVAYWIVSAIYRRYVELRVLPYNPLAVETLRTAFAGKDSKNIRTGHIDAIRLKAFMDGLNNAANRGHGKRAVRCILLSGWRLNCILQMKWAQIDFKTGIYTVLPYEEGWKGYVGEIAINEYVLGFIRERKEQGGTAESNYVFPSSYGSKHEYMVNPSGTLKTASFGVGWYVPAHDLRRTFATIADVVLDGNGRLIGLLLGHSQSGAQEGSALVNPVTGKYLVRNMQGERESSRQVAEAILQIAGMLPMDDELAAKFKKRGVDIEQITLLPMTE
jgi:integrase